MFDRKTKDSPINIFAKFIGATLSLLLITMLATTAHAQFRAAVQGTVADVNGGVVAGATVTLLNNETGKSQQTTTSDNGFYRFSALAPGSYTLNAEGKGFKKGVIENVNVDAENVQGLDILLTAGNIAETVTVTGTTETLETENGNVQKAITTTEIRSLPQVGRDPYELVRLSPGIFGAGARDGSGGSVRLPNTTGPGGSNNSIFQTENQVPISASGQRLSANNFQVDGVSVNSLQWGGAAVITPNQESVKEIQVTSSSYSAEDGRNSGAQVKVVSQNGTNAFHGSAFFKYNDPGWNAFNKFSPTVQRPDRIPTRVENRYKQFGGSLGGPIFKDKLFFFASYEGYRQNSNNFYRGYVETEQYRQQVIAARPGGKTATILAAPGAAPRIISILPRGCQDFGNDPTRCRVVNGGLDIGSLAGALNTYVDGFGVSTGGGFDGVPDIAYALIAAPNIVNGNQYNARFDYNLNEKNQLAFISYFTPRTETKADTDASSRPLSDLRNTPFNYYLTATWNHTISPTLINELRGNFTKFTQDQVKAAQETNFGFPRLEVEGLPIGGRIRFGAQRADTTPAFFDQGTFEMRDLVTKVYGNQAIKFGAEFRRELDNNDLSGGARPVYSFVGLWNLANDAPIFEGIDLDPTTGGRGDGRRFFRTNNYAFFVQDDWKVRTNLTINLGLRYELFGALKEKGNRLTNLQLGTDANALTEAKVVRVDALTKADKNNFAPRFGFAYSPSLGKIFGGSNFFSELENKVVLRGGFGIHYNRTPNVLFNNTRGNPPFYSRFNVCCGTPDNPFALTPPDSMGRRFQQIQYYLGTDTSPYSYPRNTVLGGGINSATGLPNSGSVEIWGAPQDFKNTEVYRYSLETQIELPYKLFTSIGYEGSRSRHLVRIANLNFVYPTTNSQIFAAFFPTSDGSGDYNGMNVRLERRLAQGFQVALNYRFAKSLDNLSYEGPGGETNQTYPINQSLERGPSDYDVRHNLNISGVYQMPFFKTDKSWIGKILGGWEASGIVTYHTGFPWTPKIDAGIRSLSGDFFGPIRPNGYTGDGSASNSNSNFLRPGGIFANGAQGFDLRIFNDPTTGGPSFRSNVPGVGRNSFRGPRYSNLDMSLAKNFGLPKIGFLNENSKLELRFNFFNILNTLNLANFNFFDDGTFVARGNSQQAGTNYGLATLNPRFGEASGALAGRTIEFQARFRF